MDEKERETYIVKLFPRLMDIHDHGLREKVVDVWWRTWKESDFERIEDLSQWEPIKAELGISNVEHTNQVTECALAMAEVVERDQKVDVDRDILIAGALLHDIDKLLIFSPSTGEPTTLGRHLPHTTLGAHLAMDAGLPLGVVHAIAAHSSNFSSMSPETVEAVIVFQADQAVTEVWKKAKNIVALFGWPGQKSL